MIQLSLDQVHNEDCPYEEFIDDEDGHCNNNGMAPAGYVPLGEDSDDHELHMASVNGPYLTDIMATAQPVPELPGFIPVVTHGSGKLFTKYKPEWIGVQLPEVVSGKEVRVVADVRARLGAPPDAKIMLLAYGRDGLLENLWQNRRCVLRDLARAGFDLATSINYSIWDMHPHAEKIFNVKRSLVIYQEMQEFGLTVVPHIYWYSGKSLWMWVEWLRANPAVTMVAIDLQTLKVPDWPGYMAELREFVAAVGRQLHYVITGPQAVDRIVELKSMLGSMTLTNSYGTIKAWSRRQLSLENGELVATKVQDGDVGNLFSANVAAFSELMSPATDLRDYQLGLSAPASAALWRKQSA